MAVVVALMKALRGKKTDTLTGFFLYALNM